MDVDSAAFFQGLGRKRICCDGCHQGQSEVEQFAGAEHVRHRISHSGTVVPRLGEQIVDDLREKAIWPVRMNAIAGRIKLLHCAPYSAAVLHYRHLITRDSFSGNIRDMFNIMEEGHGIVVGTQ